MKPVILDMKDISDSKEVYDSRPHSFFSMFIYLVILLFAAALIWSYFGEIEEYVRANGVVRPSGNISTVRNGMTGFIDELHIYQGAVVRRGDVLYTVGAGVLRLSLAETESFIERLNRDIKNLTKFREGIFAGENLFNPLNPAETELFNRFQNYLTGKSLSLAVMSGSEMDITRMINEAEQSIRVYDEMIADAVDLLKNNELLLQSAVSGRNLFPDVHSEFGRRFEDYLINLRRLENIYRDRRETYTQVTSLFNLGGASRNERDSARQQMELARLDRDRHRNEFTMNVQETQRRLRRQIGDIKNSVQSLLLNIEALEMMSYNIMIMEEMLKFDMLVQIEDELRHHIINVERAQHELRNIQLRLEEAVITAPIDGTVNLLVELNIGDLIHSGTDIAMIIPETGEDFRVQLMIPNQDIAGINVGQRIRFQFHALPFRDFGELYGEIHMISADARTNAATGMSYFMVEASIDNRALVSHTGEVAYIRSGMTCEARIVTNSRKILWWLLEKINLRG